jgi:hypothetical protein
MSPARNSKDRSRRFTYSRSYAILQSACCLPRAVKPSSAAAACCLRHAVQHPSRPRYRLPFIRNLNDRPLHHAPCFVKLINPDETDGVK